MSSGLPRVLGLLVVLSDVERMSSMAGRLAGLDMSGEARSFNRSSTEYFGDML